MGEPIGKHALDQTLTYKVVLGGAPLATSLAGHFTGSETLAAVVWPGSTYATIATLTAAWASTDATGATLTGNPASQASPVIDLTVSVSAISACPVGPAWVKIYIASTSELLYEGSIEFTPAIGSTALPRTYCSWLDLVAECGWIGQVEGLKDRRAAGFLPERAEASKWAERQATARWRRDIRDQYTRHAALSVVTPITLTTGIDAGPTWGPTTIEDTTFRDTETAFDTLMTSTGLMTDPPGDRGTLKAMTACYALSLALDDQVGESPTGSSYQMEATRYRRKAIGLLIGIEFRMDSDADSVSDYRMVS